MSGGISCSSHEIAKEVHLNRIKPDQMFPLIARLRSHWLLFFFYLGRYKTCIRLIVLSALFYAHMKKISKSSSDYGNLDWKAKKTDLKKKRSSLENEKTHIILMIVEVLLILM